MGTIISKEQNWILTIPKALISDKEIKKIMDLLKFYELVKASEMTEKKKRGNCPKTSKNSGGLTIKTVSWRKSTPHESHR